MAKMNRPEDYERQVDEACAREEEIKNKIEAKLLALEAEMAKVQVRLNINVKGDPELQTMDLIRQLMDRMNTEIRDWTGDSKLDPEETQYRIAEWFHKRYGEY